MRKPDADNPVALRNDPELDEMEWKHNVRPSHRQSFEVFHSKRSSSHPGAYLALNSH